MVKKSSLVLTVFLLLTIFVTAGLATPVQWTIGEGANGHWYEAFYVENGIFWGTAYTNANTKKGYLATATSENENNFIFGLVKDTKFWWKWEGDVNGQSTVGYCGPWLGGLQSQASNVTEPDGGWGWVTNETWSFTKWGPYLPLDHASGTQDYLHYYHVANGDTPINEWNDTQINTPNRGYIVEWNTNPVPLPPSVYLFGSGLIGLIGLRRFRRV